MGLWVENGLWYVQFPCGGFGDSELERAFLKLYLEKFAIMGARHRKYGPGNIAASGEAGLIVRAQDKLARLANSKADFPDESKLDTWMDLSNYSDIAIAWLRRKWPKPTVRPACPTCGREVCDTLPLFEDTPSTKQDT